MKKSTVLFAALLAVLLFIVCQFYVGIRLFPSQSKDSERRKRIILESVEKLQYWSQKLQYNVILIDPELLGRLVKPGAGRDGECQYLCQKTELVFAVENRLIDAEESFQHGAAVSGFVVQCTRAETTWARESITTHCFFQFSWGSIQLVFLHARTEGFLWFRAAGTFTIGNTAGALERFNTRIVQLDGVGLRVPSDIPAFLSELRDSHYIECDTSRAGAFFAKYGRDMSPDAVAFRNKAVDLVRLAKSALDELKVQFWLSSGTCLGWYRQCDIIPYSKDIDLGVFIRHYNPAIISSLQRGGLKLKHKFGMVSDSLELSFTKDDIKLDIFFFYEEANYTWNGGTQAKTGNKYKYIFKTFSLCWTEFFSLKLRIPCDTESYIIANYGPDWFTPVMTWDWKRSPPNVHENGKWGESVIDEAVQIFE